MNKSLDARQQELIYVNGGKAFIDGPRALLVSSQVFYIVTFDANGTSLSNCIIIAESNYGPASSRSIRGIVEVFTSAVSPE